jgi:WD40 repeat protein
VLALGALSLLVVQATALSAPAPLRERPSAGHVLKGHKSSGYALAFTPDGKVLLTLNHDLTLTRWQVATGRELSTIPLRELPPTMATQITASAFSPDARTLALARGHFGSTVELWDAITGQRLAQLRNVGVVSSLTFSPDSVTLATVGFDRRLRLWDVRTGKVRWSVQAHRVAIARVAFSPDGKLLATRGAGRVDGNPGAAFLPAEVKLWDPATGREVGRLAEPGELFGDIAFTPDSKTLIVVHHPPQTVDLRSTSKVVLWDVATRTKRATLQDNIRDLFDVRCAPDGKTVAITNPFYGGTIYLVDVGTGKTKASFRETAGERLAALAPDGAGIVTTRPDGTLSIWRAARKGAK